MSDWHPDDADHKKFLAAEKAEADRRANVRRQYEQPSGLTETDFFMMGQAIGKLVKPELKELRERVSMLEQGLAKHAGPYRHGRAYAGGEFCTRQGSLWICKSDKPTGVPGESNDWRLVVKSGSVKK